MKKLIFIFMMAFALVSCEKNYVNEFVIVNHCSDEIHVLYNVNGSMLTKGVNIPANSEQVFYTAHLANNRKKGAKETFWDMSIFLGGHETGKNLLNNDNWQMLNVTDTYTKWSLEISSEDF
jgi:hypothetical protein